MCCHVGGDIDFDAQGNLYLVTGDDSNPFSSDGFAPIDERADRNPAFDAQRTAANTNDLRGKLLRIKVSADGTYTIPAGNLFAPGTMGTKPEIYAMGFRNPFRFAVDNATGYVYLGEYGPDAGAAQANRGPGGQVEFNLIKQPGNYGWPYCTGKNDALQRVGLRHQHGRREVQLQRARRTTRSTTRASPTSRRPSRRGSPTTAAASRRSARGSESPMGGPTYHYDAEQPVDDEVPAPTSTARTSPTSSAARGSRRSPAAPTAASRPIETYFGNFGFKQLIDLEFGPDGSLYVLDYGSGGFFQGDENSAVYRIDYVSGQRSPVAVAKADKTSGPAPLAVQFSSDGLGRPRRRRPHLRVGLRQRRHGRLDRRQPDAHLRRRPLHRRADGQGPVRQGGALVGEHRLGQHHAHGQDQPAGQRRDLQLRRHDQVHDHGHRPRGRQRSTARRSSLNTALGHNDHSHGDQSMTGCSGQFTIPQAWEDKTQHTWYILGASYTDKTTGLELTGTNQVILEWSTQQAEMFDENSGMQETRAAAAAGGGRMGYTDPGDYLKFNNINLTGITSVTARTTGVANSRFEMHVDSPTGPLVASIPVVSSGDWEIYKTQEPAAVTDPGGTHDLYVVFPQSNMDLDEFTFNGPGANGNATPVISAASATPLSGAAPLKVDFTAAATDPEGTAVSYAWDFGVAGLPAATTKDASYTYTQRGLYTATLTVKDADGRTATRTFSVEVLGTCPGSDLFTGTTLDRTVWPTIVREDAANYKVENGVPEDQRRRR